MLPKQIILKSIFSSGSVATTPALSLEEEDYDWGRNNTFLFLFELGLGFYLN